MSTYGLFIGIDVYMDVRIPRLQCAARDAEVLSSMFESIGVTTSLLLNRRATTVAIRRALTALARSVSDDDTAIVYFSGHGAKERLQLKNSSLALTPYVVAFDATVDDLIATSIPMEEIGRLLGLIPCRNVLFFFDSCYSGAIASARTFTLPGVKAAERGAPVFPQISGEGRIVLAASQEYEPAFEDPNTGHGVFTEYLIEALSGEAAPNESEAVSLASIFTHLQVKVPDKTKRLFSQAQKPVQHGTITEDVNFPIIRGSPSRTLAGFPYMFTPITVVVGDRREQEPKTRGDIFALSASSAELRWLLALGLPHDTEIISDKVFRNAKVEYLIEEYGRRNLLVVGSPAANHLARLVNETAFFPFDIDPAIRNQVEAIYKEIDQYGNDRAKLLNYALDPRVREGHRFYMNQLKRGGFIDPTYSLIRRGDTIPFDRDYGVISICRNPYAPTSSADFVSILAGGVHLPATMYAFQLLSRAREEFKDKPLGGIFNVELTEIDWVKRLELAKHNWSTEPYTFTDIHAALLRLKGKERLEYARGLTEASIDGRLAFLEQLTRG